MARFAARPASIRRAGLAVRETACRDLHLGGCIARPLTWDADLLALHRQDPARYPHLLETAAIGTGLSAGHNRHDILFAFPGEVVSPSSGFLAAFDAAFHGARDIAFRAEREARDDTGTSDKPLADLPFRGGWFVYLGYELAQEIEPTLNLPRPGVDDPVGRLPVAMAVRAPAAVLRDRIGGRLTLVAEPEHAQLLDAMEDDLASLAADLPEQAIALAGGLAEDDPAIYLAAVRRAKEYIFAGDVFQANLSRAWRGRISGDPSHADLYAALRRRNPAPFAGLATFGETAVISSSPERLLRIRGDVIESRPIAGTRPRGEGRLADAALSAELLANVKERAEHIMLVDLERNDLSRVCRADSVVVDEMMAVESYAHVHHIVSNVQGRLQPGMTPAAAIAALFPGGTITGCPKVRCMEIIAELEGTARGPYTGAFGYVNRDGDMDLNILIRTLLRHDDEILFRTGAGIVADSDPLRELDETRAKARGLLRALGAAE